MTHSPDYTALQQLIAEQQWWFRADELHGILTGLIACNAFNRREEILAVDLNACAVGQSAVEHLGAHIQAGLSSAELDYQLLLACETSLAERAASLVAWAEGFLVAVHFLNPELDEDCQTFLSDLTEISRLDDALADNEENRQQLNALEEHCRMGALLLYTYTHRHPVQPPSS